MAMKLILSGLILFLPFASQAQDISPCRKLMRHVPVDNVTHQPAPDVESEADWAKDAFHLSEGFDLPLELHPLEDDGGETGGLLREDIYIDLGTIHVTPDGRALVNGTPIDQPAISCKD